MEYLNLYGAVVPAGTQLWEVKNQEESLSEAEKGFLRVLPPDHLGEIVNALAWYLPQRKEALEIREKYNELDLDEEGNIPELAIAQGVATEDLFYITGLHHVDIFTHGWWQTAGWMSEYLSEGSYRDIEAVMPEIHRDVIAYLTENFPKTREKTLIIPDFRDPDRRYNPENKRVHPFAILTQWGTLTSKDWESQITELDGFEYHGPANCTGFQHLETLSKIYKDLIQLKPGDEGKILELARELQTPRTT